MPASQFKVIFLQSTVRGIWHIKSYNSPVMVEKGGAFKPVQSTRGYRNKYGFILQLSHSRDLTVVYKVMSQIIGLQQLCRYTQWKLMLRKQKS